MFEIVNICKTRDISFQVKTPRWNTSSGCLCNVYQHEKPILLLGTGHLVSEHSQFLQIKYDEEASLFWQNLDAFIQNQWETHGRRLVDSPESYTYLPQATRNFHNLSARYGPHVLDSNNRPIELMSLSIAHSYLFAIELEGMRVRVANKTYSLCFALRLIKDLDFSHDTILESIITQSQPPRATPKAPPPPPPPPSKKAPPPPPLPPKPKAHRVVLPERSFPKGAKPAVLAPPSLDEILRQLKSLRSTIS